MADDIAPPVVPPAAHATPARPPVSDDEGWKAKLKEYRDEAQAYRLQAEAEKAAAAKAAEEARTALLAETDAKIAAAKLDADNRLIGAELKAAALRAGLEDPDLLKLMDRSALTIGDDGEVVGIDEAVKAFKTAKPYAFRDPKSTTTTTKPPATATKTEFKDLSAEQKAAQLRTLGVPV